eukprot:7383154-Prymnesium_polylepis.1
MRLVGPSLLPLLWPSQPLPAAHPLARCPPPRCVRDDLPEGVRSTDDLLIGTIEPDDVPACIDILVEAFYKDILTLAKDEFRCAGVRQCLLRSRFARDCRRCSRCRTRLAARRSSPCCARRSPG